MRNPLWDWYVKVNGEFLRADGSFDCEVCDGPMTAQNITDSHHCFHCGCATETGDSDYSERQRERSAMGLSRY
jgi:hypothetical protein